MEKKKSKKVIMESTKTKEKEDSKEKITYIKKSKKLLKSRYFIIINSILLLILISLFIFKVPMFFIVIYIVFALIITSITNIIILYNLFRDRKKLRKKIVKLSNNFINVKMFLKSGRIKNFIMPITKIGTFEFKDGEYTVDRSAMCYNELNEPCLDYHEGIPNPLKYNFKHYIELFMQNKKSVPPKKTLDWDNEEVQISYSSHTIKEMKKDKFFHEFHRDKQEEANKILRLVIIAGMISNGVWLMVFIFNSG